MSGKFALIIGNTEYIDPGLALLTAPGKDVTDFARVLKEQELCAFDQVKILLNQLSSTVIEAIDEFFDQKKPDDLLVLYFSGHGVRDEFGSLYLAFKNTIRSRLRSTAVKSEYIREAMDQSRSKRQVVILDCCNSGAFPQGTKAEVGGAMGMTVAFQGYGRFVLTASDATQFAWEGDKVIGETQNSLFTHFLVKGLEGEADSDGDGKITVDELYDFAYGQISRVTPKQTPTKSISKQEGEIVLRQITRMEDIKPVALPAPVVDSMENPLAEVRLAAVQQLIRLLNGKNLGLARSAREALQRIAGNDDSRLVSMAAAQALESSSQTVQPEIHKTEPAPIAPQKEEVQQVAPPDTPQEHPVPEKLESKESASKTLEQRRQTYQKAKEESQAPANAQVQRPSAKEESDLNTGESAAQKATPSKPGQGISDRAARVNAQRDVPQKVSVTESQPARRLWMAPTALGLGAIALVVCGILGFAALKYLGVIGGPPVSGGQTSVPAATLEETSPPSLPIDPTDQPKDTATSKPPQADQPKSTSTPRPTHTSTPRPTITWTPRPASGTCKDGYVYRLIVPGDKVCVPPASKAQADSDNAAAGSRTLLRALLDAYGENACAGGYVWRGAYNGDVVCVDPGVRQQVIDDNNAAPSRWVQGDFGPQTCISGYVWRVAIDSDLVCVLPEVRDQAAFDNAEANSRKAVNVYNGNECQDGYVWREAFQGDLVCVTPEVRQQVRQDNRDAPNHTWP
jgi:caspase domain-containing protein